MCTKLSALVAYSRFLFVGRDKLQDWRDFLLVKSKRNVTIVSYPSMLSPGPIHFFSSGGLLSIPNQNQEEESFLEK